MFKAQNKNKITIVFFMNVYADRSAVNFNTEIYTDNIDLFPPKLSRFFLKNTYKHIKKAEERRQDT